MYAVTHADPRDYYTLAVGVGPDYDGDGIADAPGYRRRGPFGSPAMATLLGIFLVLVVWYFLKNRNLLPAGLSTWGAGPTAAVTPSVPDPVPGVSPYAPLGPAGASVLDAQPTVTPRFYDEPASRADAAPRAFEPAPPPTGVDTPVVPPVATVPTMTLRVKNPEGIYLWDCLDAGCQRLSLLRLNTRVTLLGESTVANNEEWVRVRIGNQVGWVSRYYLE